MIEEDLILHSRPLLAHTDKILRLTHSFLPSFLCASLPVTLAHDVEVNNMIIMCGMRGLLFLFTLLGLLRERYGKPADGVAHFFPLAFLPTFSVSDSAGSALLFIG